MSDEEFEGTVAQLDKIGIRVETCNGFFPSQFRLYAYDPLTKAATGEIDEIKENVRTYARQGFARAKQLGTTLVVIGSGGARRRPEELPHALAEAQLAEILSICATVAADYGIAVTLEPLNQNETNLINTLSESLDLMDRIGHPNIFAMVDFYHFSKENEPMRVLDRAGGRLRHVHLCRADRYSCTPADYDDLLPFVEHLKTVGYDARLSFEGKLQNDDAAQALRDTYELFRRFRTV